MRNTLKQTGRMSTASSYAAGFRFVVSREAPVKRIVGLAFQYWKLEDWNHHSWIQNNQQQVLIAAVAGKGTEERHKIDQLTGHESA